MSLDISKVIDSFFKFDKIPNRLFFLGFVISFLYLSEPANWMLFDGHSGYRVAAQWTFVICFGMFSMNLIFWIIKGIYKQIKIFRFKRNFKEVYRNLDYFEQNVIREFYLQGKNTLAFPYFDPLIQGLVSKSVLRHASSVSGGHIIDGITASYRLNKYIIPFVKPSFDFDLPKNNSREEIKRIEKTRPHWLQ